MLTSLAIINNNKITIFKCNINTLEVFDTFETDKDNLSEIYTYICSFCKSMLVPSYYSIDIKKYDEYRYWYRTLYRYAKHNHNISLVITTIDIKDLPKNLIPKEQND
ncbi:MAG: hypothetical protein PVF17_01450 [Ignavibacteria bacterium]|jgi:hypothetical protein